GSLTRYVAERDQDLAVAALDKVVIVAAALIARERDALDLISRDDGRARGLKTLLYLGRKLELALHPLALHPGVYEAGVLDPNRRHRCERRQDVEVLLGKHTFGGRRIGIDEAENM